jgi:hypothetical protein
MMKFNSEGRKLNPVITADKSRIHPELLRIHKTGLIYRNPRPHVQSIHAYFPSVGQVGRKGEMLATVTLGEAFESVDLHTHVLRSIDGGETWEMQGEIYRKPPERLTSDLARLTVLPNDDVLVFMARHDRSGHPDEGLANAANLGFVPTELMTLRSRDGGSTWSGPIQLKTPLEGPAFEMCSPIITLQDGRLVLPTSTWRGWNADCPNGMRMVAFVSKDNGLTWPEYMDVMHDERQNVIYWESKIIELKDGRLVAVAWAYDEKQGKDLPNQFALSDDSGKTWTQPASMGLFGQTLTPLVLDDGRILCVYRRMDLPGLWAAVGRLDGDAWVNDGHMPLWGFKTGNLTKTDNNMVSNFNVLRFGAPCVIKLFDGTIFIAFWCYEDCVSNIRYIKIEL